MSKSTYTYGPFWDLLNSVSEEFNFVPFEANASASANAGPGRHERKRGHHHGPGRGHGFGPGFPFGRGGFRGPFERDGNNPDTEISVSPLIHRFKQSTNENGDPVEDEINVTPRVDVYDAPKSYIVVADVPGANGSTINVDFDTETNELVISGSLNHPGSLNNETEFRNKYLKIGERRVGKFERKIRVPVEPKVNEENIRAKFLNGVLKVSLPKVEPVVVEKKKVVVTIDDEDESEQEVIEEKPVVQEPDTEQDTDGEEKELLDEDSVLVDKQ